MRAFFVPTEISRTKKRCIHGFWPLRKWYLNTRKNTLFFTCENIIFASQSKTTYEIYLTNCREHVVKRTRVECFATSGHLGFCKINYFFFGEQKFFCQTFFKNMATRFLNITDDDVEIIIEGKEDENTRKKRGKIYRFSSHSLQAKDKKTSHLK